MPPPIFAVLALAASVFGSLASRAQTLVITNGVRTVPGLTNTTVTLSNRCELRITSAANPLPGSLVNLASIDALLVLPNIKPSAVVTSCLSQIRIGGAVAVADGNCRVVQYGGGGTLVVPHGSSFQPLSVFSGPHFTGTSASLGKYVYHKGTALGAMNARISSFKLKRGYAVTLAQRTDGSGFSRNYVAQDGDLDVSLLPANLENNVRFVYVVPWRWASKKGIAGNIEGPLNVQWKYNWNLDQNSTRDLEYVPIRQNRWWPDLASQNWQTRGACALLGYNEPDRPDQANLAVSDAIAAWPDLLATGLRLGAPAVSDGGRSGWLYPFMSQADAAGLRVDFVPVHYYWCFNPANPAGAASQMYGFLKEVYDTTQRPVWITEWNNGANWTGCADPTYAQHQACIAAMLEMLESTPFVERYALYNWVEDVRRLEWDNGSLTDAGVTYRDRVSSLAYQQAAPDNGTRGIAQLRFEGDTLDSSGFGNHGVTTGSPGYSNGVHGQALTFDGTNTTVTLPPNLAHASAFTFAAWVYWAGGGNWQRIFDFGNSPTQYLFLTPSSGSGTLRFAIKNGGNEQIVEATAALARNQWQHVAVTLNGSTARLYVDGALVKINTALSILPSAFNPHVNFLGKSQFVADPAFKGALDEVVIADTALAAAQIAALLTNTPPQFSSPVLASHDAIQGQPYTNQIANNATDANANPLIFSKAAGPAWLNVSANGTLTGTPTASNFGTNYFTLRALDSAGASGFAVLPVVVQTCLTGGPALLARYRFDGNAHDSSGNTFHGAVIGSPSYVAGKYGSALDLDGSTDYVTLPWSLPLGLSNFTIAAWVYWDGGKAWQRIFDFGNDTTHYLCLTPSSGNGTLRFAINNGSGEQILESAGLASGLWQHVAITRNGNTCRLYRNGTQAALSASITTSPASFNPEQNQLGKSQFPDPLFDGRLDDFYIYNYALSATEIARLMNNLPPPPTTPTALLPVLTGNTLRLSWPPDYLGCRLESNSVSLTSTAAWATVPGSANTAQVTLALDPTATNVFFRLVYP
jgi:hypothetical protein